MTWRAIGRGVTLALVAIGCRAGTSSTAALDELAEVTPRPRVSTAQSASPVRVELEPELPPLDPDPPPIRTPRVDCQARRADGYRKGRRTPITVVEIDGRPIEVATASAYVAMAAAAAEEGLQLALFSGFRSMEEQRYFYRCYRTCSCNSCNKAARPGYSNHQNGVALDLGLGQGVHPWLLDNAARFGFRATVRSEPWHWEYRKRKAHRFPAVCPDARTARRSSGRG